ncbi:SET and MYND domain-containing protein 4 isoform X2 [Ambystoma mexicanum]|uniref:SET and MYND domain-containing protein 4 isoform X2 n=1 Tax=Ambystoma mexicanum TaxID=8296 RepID=UPI0037E9C127
MHWDGGTTLLLMVSSAEDENILRSISAEYSVAKDPSASAFYKEEGNQRFQRKEYSRAAVFYSKAASHARNDSEDIAVCYANRSAALFYLKLYAVCLEDIERALEKGYPETLQHKVLIRKADCLLHLGRCSEALETIGKLEGLASNNALSSNTRQSLLSSIVNLTSRVTGSGGKSVSSGVTGMKNQHEMALPGEMLSNDLEDLRVWDESAYISKASAALGACFSPARGRHLVASRDIDPGETLVQEEAFVIIVIPEGLLQHESRAGKRWDHMVTNADLYCHRCLRQAHSAVPCRGCCYARYCSQQCLEKAWDSYHSVECTTGSVLLSLGVFCHVALRTVLVTEFGEVSRLVKEYHEEMAEKKELSDASCSFSGSTATSTSGESSSVEKHKGDQAFIAGSDGDGHYHSSYQTVFSLLTHTEHQSPEHRFLCALSTATICKMVRIDYQQSFVLGPIASENRLDLKTEVHREWSTEQRILGVAMFRHMLQLTCNALAVTTIREQPAGDPVSMVESQEQVRLATAFFPVTSLLNHSCDPNTSMSFRGRSVLVRAAQPIKRGQEVALSYGPHRSKMALSRRQQLLSQQYFFKCTCHACLEEKGLSLRASWDSFCCPKCKSPMQGEALLSCSIGDCGVTIHSERLMRQQRDLEQQVRKAVDLLEADKPGLALQLLGDCQSKAQGFLSSEHVLMAQIQDHLARVHAAQGNWKASAVHLQSSIRHVELRYGASSIELGQELFKLAQIFFNGRAVTEAMDAIIRAEKVLSVHYGPRHEPIQELQEMKACLLEMLKFTRTEMK